MRLARFREHWKCTAQTASREPEVALFCCFRRKPSRLALSNRLIHGLLTLVAHRSQRFRHNRYGFRNSAVVSQELLKARNRFGRLLANHQRMASFADFHETPVRPSTPSCVQGLFIVNGRPARLAVDRAACLDGQSACRIWGTPSHPGSHRPRGWTTETRAVRRRTLGRFSDQGPWKKTRSSRTRHLLSAPWPQSRELPLSSSRKIQIHRFGRPQVQQ